MTKSMMELMEYLDTMIGNWGEDINCKDCKHYIPWNHANNGYCQHITEKNYISSHCDDDDYCVDAMDVDENFGCKFFERKVKT